MGSRKLLEARLQRVDRLLVDIVVLLHGAGHPTERVGDHTQLAAQILETSHHGSASCAFGGRFSLLGIFREAQRVLLDLFLLAADHLLSSLLCILDLFGCLFLSLCESLLALLLLLINLSCDSLLLMLLVLRLLSDHESLCLFFSRLLLLFGSLNLLFYGSLMLGHGSLSLESILFLAHSLLLLSRCSRSRGCLGCSSRSSSRGRCLCRSLSRGFGILLSCLGGDFLGFNSSFLCLSLCFFLSLLFDGLGLLLLLFLLSLLLGGLLLVLCFSLLRLGRLFARRLDVLGNLLG